MAFRSDGPVILSFPAFRGVTRQIVLASVGVFLGTWVLGIVVPDIAFRVVYYCSLRPEWLLRGQVWEVVTYPLMAESLLGLAFALLTVWMFGAQVEDERGSRWFAEYCAVATAGGAVLATLVSVALGRWVPGLEVVSEIRGAGMWPLGLAILLAFARLNAEQEIRFNFIFKLKAKYLVALYVGFYLLSALLGGDRFGAVLALTNAAAGWGFLRLAPRKGLRFAASETVFGWRNAYYRAKRRRAGKKFEVYMREQGKDVKVEEPKGGDSKDKGWMN